MGDRRIENRLHYFEQNQQLTRIILKNNALVGNAQGVSIVAGPVLEERINAVSVEHFAVEDVVPDLVAAVHHERHVHHQTGADAIVATGVRLVGG